MEETLRAPLAFTASSPSCAPTPPHYQCGHASAGESGACRPREAALRRGVTCGKYRASCSLARSVPYTCKPTTAGAGPGGHPRPMEATAKAHRGTRMLWPGPSGVGLGWTMSPAVQATVPQDTGWSGGTRRERGLHQEPAGGVAGSAPATVLTSATCAVSNPDSQLSGAALCLFLSNLYSFVKVCFLHIY